MRILHTLEQNALSATPTTLRLMVAAIAATPELDHEVVLIGGKPMRDMAKAAGLQSFRLIGQWTSRPDVISRLLKRRGVDVCSFDINHDWSHNPAYASGPMICRFRENRFRKTADRTNPLRCTFGLRHAYEQSHDLKLAHLPHAKHVHAQLPIPADIPISPPLPSLETLHARWEAPHEVANVILLTESLPGPDAYQAALAVTLAEDTDTQRRPRLRLLVHPDQDNRVRACTTVNNLGAPHRVVDEPYILAPWMIAHVCRFALIARDTPLPLVAWAMHAGLVIVGEHNDAASELLIDGRTAMLTATGEPKHLAYRLRMLLDDPQLADQVSQNAKAMVAERLPFDAFERALRSVYELVHTQNVREAAAAS